MKTVQGSAGRSRALLNAIKKQKGVITTQSYLRCEAVLGNSSTINFATLVNEAIISVTEKRLAITDAFTITAMSFMIYRKATAENNSSRVLQTYPNPNIFPTTESPAIQGIYNGFLSIRVGSVVYLDSFDVFRFYRVNQAQQGLEVSTALINNNYLRSGYEGGDYPFYGLTPSIRISGATKNELQITLPESQNMAAAAGHTNYGVLYMRGFLEQNGANFRTNKSTMRGRM